MSKKPDRLKGGRETMIASARAERQFRPLLLEGERAV